MKYCKKCVQPDTRPGIYFSKDGICGACLWQDSYNNTINWDRNYEELVKIVKTAKKKGKKEGLPYDCVIGISGGKDSTFQALYARDKLGLKCLLVNGEPDAIHEIGRKNIENIKNLGFDVISLRPNPSILKKLIKKDFFRYCNPVKATEYPLWTSAYIVADMFNIPLVIQGENQGLTVGTLKGFGTGDDALRANKQHTIEKNYIDEYVNDEQGVSERDLFFYHYDRKTISQKGIKAIWIQYYSKEWSSPGNGEFAIKNGLSLRPENYNPSKIGQYWRFNALDGGSLVYVNQMLKHIKLGFGATTDSACYEIREGRITREEGIKLVCKFDGKCDDEYIKAFCKYIDISERDFWKTVNAFRGKMWEKRNGEWKLKNSIWEQINVDDVSIDHILDYHKNIDTILKENKKNLMLKPLTHKFELPGSDLPI